MALVHPVDSDRCVALLKRNQFDTCARNPQGIVDHAFEIILEWLYCGEAALIPSMLPSLLDAAVRLELTSLQGAAAKALEDNLSADTCLLVWEAADSQGLTEAYGLTVPLLDYRKPTTPAASAPSTSHSHRPASQRPASQRAH